MLCRVRDVARTRHTKLKQRAWSLAATGHYGNWEAVQEAMIAEGLDPDATRHALGDASERAILDRACQLSKTTGS